MSAASIRRRVTGLWVACTVVAAGCATPLERARRQFDQGRLAEAEQTLQSASVRPEDRVLFLMERGAIRQALGDYETSTRDFIEAADLIEEWETYSVTRGAASWVTSDVALRYRGAPYERTLLHALAALNHLAIGHWENAAVEARRIVRTLEPEALGGYPDCAFARAVAGFCFEMIDDASNAALQYRRAGDIRSASLDWEPGRGQPEVVVFALLGRMPNPLPDLTGDAANAPVVEIVWPDGSSTRATPLTDTLQIAIQTEQRQAAMKAAKTVARVVLKDQIAEVVRRQTDNAVLGDLTRFVLIGLLERPDLRRWETLPRYLYVVRAAAPEPPPAFRLRVLSPGGAVWSDVTLPAPTVHRGRTWVVLYREVPPRSYY